MANKRKDYSEKKRVITVAIPGKLYDYIKTKDNYSKYICDLIETDMIAIEDLEDLDKQETKEFMNKILKRLF